MSEQVGSADCGPSREECPGRNVSGRMFSLKHPFHGLGSSGPGSSLALITKALTCIFETHQGLSFTFPEAFDFLKDTLT